MNDLKNEDVMVELTMLEEAITRAVVVALKQDRMEQATAKFEAATERSEAHARWLAQETAELTTAAGRSPGANSRGSYHVNALRSRAEEHARWLQRLEIKDLA